MNYQHTPVLLRETIYGLNPRPGDNFIDCTLGGGGYTAALAGRVGSLGRILAIDRDALAIENAKLKFKKNKNSP